MNKLRRYLRQLVSVFDIPRSEPTPPKPKSPLRLQFETEWSEAVNSAGRALNLAALGIVSGVCLLLQGLLCSGQKMHAALAKHTETPATEELWGDLVIRELQRDPHATFGITIKQTEAQ